MNVSLAGLPAITIGLGLKTEDLGEIKESLAELNELVEALGSPVVGSLVQRMDSWNPSTLMGSGKILEVKELVEETGAKFVVVDHHLSGAQARNIEGEVGVPAVDRTELIIEIFARRARSHEGKLQVDLARHLDLFSRMVGAWHGSLSRLGGGIGTRGPGEKAIELDRRTIRDRISKIRKELEDTRAHRSLHRSSRRRHNIPSFALIGYTNAGKSTLLSELTHSQVYVADQVFATLDPTTRKVFLPGAPEAVITDTVGFIRKLPTQLVEAFKATLEETGEADILIHVIDFASPDWIQQMQTVEKLIDEFGWRTKPILYVFNKCDMAPADRKFKVTVHPRVFISALKKEGLGELKSLMTEELKKLSQPIELFFSHADRAKVYELARDCSVIKQEEASTGVVCIALLNDRLKSKWNDYVVR